LNRRRLLYQIGLPSQAPSRPPAWRAGMSGSHQEPRRCPSRSSSTLRRHRRRRKPGWTRTGAVPSNQGRMRLVLARPGQV